MSGLREGQPLHRGPQVGNIRPGKPIQGNMQQRMQRRRMQDQGLPMGQNGDKPPLAEGAGSGTSEVQSDQSMGEVAPDSKPPNRGSQFRKKMRKARRNKARQRMQRRRAGHQGQKMRQFDRNGPGKRGGPRENR